MIGRISAGRRVVPLAIFLLFAAVLVSYLIYSRQIAQELRHDASVFSRIYFQTVQAAASPEGFTAEGDEVELEYEPGVAAKLSGLLPLPLGLEGGASGRYMGKQYCENPELGGLDSFSSSHHLDLSLRRVFGFDGPRIGRAEAVLNLDNATDSLVLDQCGLPQPGRTLRIQLRFW